MTFSYSFPDRDQMARWDYVCVVYSIQDENSRHRVIIRCSLSRGRVLQKLIRPYTVYVETHRAMSSPDIMDLQVSVAFLGGYDSSGRALQAAADFLQEKENIYPDDDYVRTHLQDASGDPTLPSNGSPLVTPASWLASGALALTTFRIAAGILPRSRGRYPLSVLIALVSLLLGNHVLIWAYASARGWGWRVRDYSP